MTSSRANRLTRSVGRIEKSPKGSCCAFCTSAIGGEGLLARDRFEAEVDVEPPPVGPRVFGLVLPPARVADRERLQRGAGLATGDRRDERRVDASGEEDAERHVGDALAAHRPFECFRERLERAVARKVRLADRGAGSTSTGSREPGLPGLSASGRAEAGACPRADRKAAGCD